MDPPAEPGRNVLIGYGAALPEGVTHDAVVLGSAASTVYLGGAAVSASAAALTLGGSTTLVAGGSAGTAGQILQSTGTGVQWAAATAAVTAARTFTADETVSSSYSVYVYAGMATATLTLPAVGTSPALVGVALSIKNTSLSELTVSGAALMAPNSTAVVATAPLASGASCQIVSDGTNWLILDASGEATQKPSVNSLLGPLSGTVTITGTNFFEGNTTVKFGTDAPIAASVTNPTTATVNIPENISGTITPLSVTTPGGTSVGGPTYTYLGVPTITSISPVFGPLNIQTSLTITGTNFVQGFTTVTVGGVTATNVNVTSPSQLTALAPASAAAGAVDVTVTTPGGSYVDPMSFSYYETTSTYNYTGANQEFVVPFDCKITAIVAGSVGTWGANGAVITGTFTATAGSKLAIVVGQYDSTYAGGTNNQYGINGGGGGGYSAVINGPSNVNSNGTPIANEPNCIYIMAGGGGGSIIGYGWYRSGTGGLWNANANPMSQGGGGYSGSTTVTGGYTTNYIGNGAGGVGTTNGAKFTGGNGSGGAGGYYGGGGYDYTYGGGGGGSSYVNQSVTAVTSAATNGDAGTVTLTIVQ